MDFQSTKSEAGEQSLLRGCEAEVRVKGVFSSHTLVSLSPEWGSEKGDPAMKSMRGHLRSLLGLLGTDLSSGSPLFGSAMARFGLLRRRS